MNAALQTSTLEAAWRSCRKIDLTHRLEVGIPAWPTHQQFGLAPVESMAAGAVSCHNALSMSEHSGTHFDAPKHFMEDTGWSIDAAPVESFFGPLLTIAPGNVQGGMQLGLEVLTEWEALHGPVEPGDAVFFHFGWDRFWRDNADPDRFLRDWPGLGAALCGALVARHVRMVGTDCVSIDASGTGDFVAHHALLGAGILIGENFNNLGLLPPRCSAATLPLPIAGGTGSPVRAIAFLT